MVDEEVDFAELGGEEILRRHYAAKARWLSVNEVAARWSVHRSTVYRACLHRGLPFMRLGGKNGLRISSYWLPLFEARNVNRID